jgi:hypothetical protein
MMDWWQSQTNFEVIWWLPSALIAAWLSSITPYIGGWVGPRAGMDVLVYRKSCSCGNRTPAAQLVARLYTDSSLQLIATTNVEQNNPSPVQYHTREDSLRLNPTTEWSPPCDASINRNIYLICRQSCSLWGGRPGFDSRTWHPLSVLCILFLRLRTRWLLPCSSVTLFAARPVRNIW